jgi:hypothetical protein
VTIPWAVTCVFTAFVLVLLGGRVYMREHIVGREIV